MRLTRLAIVGGVVGVALLSFVYFEFDTRAHPAARLQSDLKNLAGPNQRFESPGDDVVHSIQPSCAFLDSKPETLFEARSVKRDFPRNRDSV